MKIRDHPKVENSYIVSVSDLWSALKEGEGGRRKGLRKELHLEMISSMLCHHWCVYCAYVFVCVCCDRIQF